MIELVVNNALAGKKIRRQFFETILTRAQVISGLATQPLGLSINLVTAKQIRSLNRRYRAKDKVTDVLAFPLGKNENTAIMEIGDIFICLPRAAADARAEKITLEAKLTFLTVHGFLHLLGYDHEKSEKDRKEMEKLENKILTPGYF